MKPWMKEDRPAAKYIEKDTEKDIDQDIERRLLAALCSAAVDAKTRTGLLDRLAKHKFATPDHETIFRALGQMPLASAEQIRETLGARVTRLGFPDIDVEPIFEVEAPTAEEIDKLLKRLDS